MEEKCGSTAICFVAFLPDIFYSKAEGRNKYLETLLSIAEEFKKSPYSYVGCWRPHSILHHHHHIHQCHILHKLLQLHTRQLEATLHHLPTHHTGGCPPSTCPPQAAPYAQPYPPNPAYPPQPYGSSIFAVRFRLSIPRIAVL